MEEVLYRACPSVEDYVLVNYRSQLVEVFHRQGRFWTYQTYEAGDECELRTLAFRFQVSAIYARTTIPIAPEPPAPASRLDT